MLDEAEFHRLADAAMMQIEEAVEASGADIDYETAGEVLTLEFADGSRIIVNKQTPARQLWVAARSGGFHYDYDAASGRWINDQGGGELLQELSRLASEQAGGPVTLTPD